MNEATLTVGGSGAILACGAARLGLRVALCGLVGDDLFGRYMCDASDRAASTSAGWSSTREAPRGSPWCSRRLDDRAMLTATGSIGGLRADLIDPDVLSTPRATCT